MLPGGTAGCTPCTSSREARPKVARLASSVRTRQPAFLPALGASELLPGLRASGGSGQTEGRRRHSKLEWRRSVGTSTQPFDLAWTGWDGHEGESSSTEREAVSRSRSLPRPFHASTKAVVAATARVCQRRTKGDQRGSSHLLLPCPSSLHGHSARRQQLHRAHTHTSTMPSAG
jgi:hypothetical protein